MLAVNGDALAYRHEAPASESRWFQGYTLAGVWSWCLTRWRFVLELNNEITLAQKTYRGA